MHKSGPHDYKEKKSNNKQGLVLTIYYSIAQKRAYQNIHSQQNKISYK